MLFTTLCTGWILKQRTRKYRSEGFPERDISSLRALGPGGGQISRVVHVSTRAAFGVSAEKYGFVQEGHTFIEKVWLRAKSQSVSQ